MKRDSSRGPTLVKTGVYVFITILEFVQLGTCREDRLCEGGLGVCVCESVLGWPVTVYDNRANPIGPNLL